MIANKSSDYVMYCTIDFLLSNLHCNTCCFFNGNMFWFSLILYCVFPITTFFCLHYSSPFLFSFLPPLPSPPNTSLYPFLFFQTCALKLPIVTLILLSISLCNYSSIFLFLYCTTHFSLHRLVLCPNPTFSFVS